MALTVGDVIALPVVQAGDPQVLSDRRWDAPIRWVHVGEVADLSALLQGGELVLTTGTALHSEPERYLRGLAEAGALGVVVELGPAYDGPPPPVVALARRLDLALVALRRQIRFVDVTEVVHRRIVTAQFDEVAFDRRVHETFTELSMNRASATAIVDAAADIVDEPVVLEDLAHQAIIASTHGGRAANVLDDWERRSRRAPTGPGAWAVTAVGPRGEEWGRLIIPRPPADPGRATMVLERAAAALSLHQMIERNRTGLHQQAQSGLVEDVLGGRITDDREIAARAHALGLRVQAAYHPAVVRVARTREHTDPVAAQRHNASLLAAVVHAVNSAGHSGLFSVRGDGEIGALVALRPGRGSADTAFGALGERLYTDLLRLDGVRHAVCALGESETQVAAAVRGLPRAQHIAEVAIAMDGSSRRVFRASDVRLRGLIALLRDDPRVQQFAESELRPLLIDEGAGLEVLREFVRCRGNKALLAQRLHMSRPALYKRLAAISDGLGVDLDDAESATSLHVALLILDSRPRG
ncbi:MULTISPECIES: PucR family transcriptional regulator [Mycobacteriaceae]|uniref:PucR family transcriptional regulator n=1 Tax=Mycobacteriaceae TaxID=1762 RepID=UPI0007FECD7E|nr:MULTISPECIES: PucR family transcriptional regulator [Mycobacteriaceae]MCK0174866.1 PucR family transcriptional regulator [Mycolicibacterium sp. F2034L]OBB59230.1 PucR family transcriptional regulator [Mycobacterium sp. 852013-51886_SCH5428379]